jgi:sec-independent protein translocase protein TatA
MGLALIPGIGSLGGTELIIALVIILLLFGAKRIPELARGLGSGVREFRQGTREGQLEDKKEEEKNEQDKKDEEDEEDLASTEVKGDDTVDASADASAQPDASVETDSTEQKHR